MDRSVDELQLAEPYLGEWLASLGLGVEYVRARGNTLFRRDDEGREKPVLDLVGGYGSTILGHNNPVIVDYAKELLEAGTPIHAQFSRHPYANDLARKVNTIIQREFGTTETYSAVFANSGAEAVEIAVKHAELDRVSKLTEALEGIEANIEAARAAVRAGARVEAGDALAGALAEPADGARPADGAGPGPLDRLVARLRAANDERRSAPPVFLAPAGSFHGKLIGTVQFTHNPGYRTPFSALAAQVRFVPLDEPEALERTVEEERRTLLDLAVGDGAVRVVERDLPVIGAFVLEPIQGEAGIRPLDPEAVRRIQAVCARIDCPIIVDEVQSGMGRSGAFFASSHLGLQGDYFTLAKSLGGGVAKAGLTLVRSSRYRRDFELVHSSTFAKDSFSTLIAGRTVDLLEADGGRAYRLAEERGARLTELLDGLRQEFGDVVKDVRGRGLMLGVEFHDQSDSPSEIIREQAAAGLLGYLFSGYLLRVHDVRAFPTASATGTLRIEPSIHLTDEEIAQTVSALRALAATLRKHDGETLLHGHA